MRIIEQATRLSYVFALAGMSMCVLQGKTDQKLAAAELVSKHLEAIGPAEARARVRGMKIKGTCFLIVRQGGTGQVNGEAMMASQGNMNLINMTFNSPDYPYETLKYDGKNFIASQFRPGLRTSLAQFFLTNDVLFKEGVVGGTLSASWPLLNLQDKNPKLEYSGLKRIEGKQMHALKYMPRKGSDLKITLFFDAETFQHIRSEYERTIYTTDQQRIGGGGGTLPSPSSQRSSNARINAFEEFSDFKPEGGLNLPHTYKFELSIQSEVRPALVDWTFTLTDFNFNDVVEFKVTLAKPG
ncbi:MAG: hypothetical protein ACREBG_31145 [Pyrinomonadaceae bacterium]